jgi:hypothetical protein
VKKISIILLLTVFVSGCAPLIKSLNYKKEFADPKRSLVLMYVRFDKDTYAGWVHFLAASGNDDDLLTHVGDRVKEGECALFAGTTESNVYEIQSISGQNVVYKFERNAPYNIKFNITKPDVYFIGQYELGLADKSGFTKKGTFSFNKTTGCPGEKTAYKEILRDEDFSGLLKETQWPERLKRKSSTIK